MKKGLVKDFAFQVKEIDKKGIVSIYVNAFGNVDSYNEVSMPGSFTKTILEGIKRVKHLKNHRKDLLLGLPLEMREDSFGLLVRSAMNMEKQLVKDVYSDYVFFAENQRTLEHSIGYDLIKYEIDNETRIQKNLEYRLYEYSTLDFLGANELTPLIDIKSAEKIKDALDTLEAMLKHDGYTDERYKEMELKCDEIRQLYNHISLEKEAVIDTSIQEPTAQEIEAERKKQFYLLTIKNY
jgi:HK97 family phage prohead protease